WQGVVLVTVGSLICYFVTREKPKQPQIASAT
ncbi:MAG: EamA family transporter, partial [Pseudoalteromonas sp.]